MVRSKGFEPLTFWFVAKHSIQLSYERMPRCILKWWLQRELNQRHKDFQSSALPTELWSQKKWRSRRESNSRSSAWQADVITATPRDHWLRKLDLNQRPSGYEPDELPSCSIPRYTKLKWRRKRDSNPRAVADLPVFKTGPFNQTWVFLQKISFDKNDYNILFLECQQN